MLINTSPLIRPSPLDNNYDMLEMLGMGSTNLDRFFFNNAPKKIKNVKTTILNNGGNNYDMYVKSLAGAAIPLRNPLFKPLEKPNISALIDKRLILPNPIISK